MSHNTLINKIKSDAAAEAEEIKKDGQLKVESILREVDKQIEIKRESFAQDLKKELDQMELVALSKAKQTAKLAVQAEKRKQINNLFDTLKSELISQSTDDYVKYFGHIAKEVVPKGIDKAKIYYPASREKETEEILSKVDCKGKLMVDESISAGLIIDSVDGVYDITLDRLLSDKRTALEIEVVKQIMS